MVRDSFASAQKVGLLVEGVRQSGMNGQHFTRSKSLALACNSGIHLFELSSPTGYEALLAPPHERGFILSSVKFMMICGGVPFLQWWADSGRSLLNSSL